jgi:hypothetical protein
MATAWPWVIRASERTGQSRSTVANRSSRASRSRATGSAPGASRRSRARSPARRRPAACTALNRAKGCNARPCHQMSSVTAGKPSRIPMHQRYSRDMVVAVSGRNGRETALVVRYRGIPLTTRHLVPVTSSGARGRLGAPRTFAAEAAPALVSLSRRSRFARSSIRGEGCGSLPGRNGTFSADGRCTMATRVVPARLRGRRLRRPVMTSRQVVS